MAVKADRGGSALAVERAADVLFLLARLGDVSISELAAATDSSASAVHRILTALRNKGLVEQDPDTQHYELSRAVLRLARSLSSRADVRRFAVPHMHSLRDRFGETATLSVRSGSGRVCIQQVEGTHEIRWVSEIGRVYPLHSGVTGKVLLAYSDPKELAAYLQSLESRRRREPDAPDRAQLVAELDQVRASGCAMSDNDRVAGIAAVSAPIFGPPGTVAAALTMAGPSWRCTHDVLERWVPHLRAAVDEITGLLAPTGDGV
jgi:DNA-binding IclR family transcriptional regulator